MHREDIIHAARPLRRIFWGALLVLLDIYVSWTVNGTGFRFDFLNDTAGMLLITAAVGRLRDIPVYGAYESRMRFIHWVSILALIDSVMAHFIFQKPWLLGFLGLALNVAVILAILSFCACMRDLCRAAALDEAAGKWRRTYGLFLVFHGIPSLVLVLLGLHAMITGQAYHFDQTPGAALIYLTLVPIFFFFGATSTMVRAAEAMPDAPMAPAPLPPAIARRGR